MKIPRIAHGYDHEGEECRDAGNGIDGRGGSGRAWTPEDPETDVTETVICAPRAETFPANEARKLASETPIHE